MKMGADSKDRGFRCLRCGGCCQEVGRFFWTHGNLDAEKPFGDHDLLNAQAKAKADEADYIDTGPCEMLLEISGEMFCAIEKYAGREYKPRACVVFPVALSDCWMNPESEHHFETENVRDNGVAPAV